MLKSQPLPVFVCLAMASVMDLAVGPAAADVTMKQRVEIQAGGAMSMMNSASNVTTSVAGDKARTETRMEEKSGLIGSFMKKMNSTNITRLDREVMWNLVPDKQQYSEMTFEAECSGYRRPG